MNDNAKTYEDGVRWQKCRNGWSEKDQKMIWCNYPKEPGHYRILISPNWENYETSDGFIVSEPDYETWGVIAEVDGDTGEVCGEGFDGEEWCEVVAWCGPFHIPERYKDIIESEPEGLFND